MLAAVGGLVVGVSVAGGFAWAAIPDSGSGVITACYPKTGTQTLRVIDAQAGQKCATSEQTLSWQANGQSLAQVEWHIAQTTGGLCMVPTSGTANAGLANCNLSKRNLTSWSLPGVDFRGTNLAGATLIGANLTDGNLWGANLVGASMRSANLSGANLTGANLAAVDLNAATIGTTGPVTYLNGANLTADVFTVAQFTNASLLNADLTGAINLASATFVNTICPDGVNSDTVVGHTCLGHTSGINASALGGLAASSYQKRVTGTCANGSAINTVNPDGTTGCTKSWVVPIHDVVAAGINPVSVQEITSDLDLGMSCPGNGTIDRFNNLDYGETLQLHNVGAQNDTASWHYGQTTFGASNQFLVGEQTLSPFQVTGNIGGTGETQSTATNFVQGDFIWVQPGVVVTLNLNAAVTGTGASACTVSGTATVAQTS
jgi:uncharacterized protein YjbI with pentapeptide repeats